MEARARAAGVDYLLNVPLPGDVPTAVVEVVKEFEHHMNQPKPPIPRVCHLLSRHIQTPVVSHFLVGGVLDTIVLHLMTDVTPLVVSKYVSVLFSLAIERGINTAHIVCGLAPLLTLATSTSVRTSVTHVLSLVRTVAQQSQSIRSMIADLQLFRNMAYHMLKTEENLTIVCDVVVLGTFYDRLDLVDDIVQNGLFRINSAMETVAHMLSTCLCHNPRLREEYAETMVDIVRHTSCHHGIGSILAYLLDTPSVQFVVLLAQQERLSTLVQVARAQRGCYWRIVSHRLRCHWPEQVATILGDAAPKDSPVTTAECPITYERMRRPVVASDGHSYERVAIVRHMVTFGAWSPITRQPISYHLYANRVLIH